MVVESLSKQAAAARLKGGSAGAWTVAARVGGFGMDGNGDGSGME